MALLLAVTVHAQKVTVSGIVMDADTKESLIGATVYAGERGTVTDNDGRYSLTLPSDRADSLHCSYIGYQAASISIDFRRDTTIIFFLVPGNQLSGVTVSARNEYGIQSTLMGVVTIPVEVINKSPVALGEADVLKTLQLLPGVQSGMEGTSGLYIRGGGEDENLFLLDGVPLYNVNHLLGVFSAFTPDAVKRVTLYKGAFPARLGGRVSGIVDVRTNDGNSDHLQGSVGIGMLTDKVHLEGPIISDKTTFSISGRIMHTMLLAPIIKLSGLDGNYFFYDLNGKLTHRFSDQDRLYFTLYSGNDVFNYRVDDDAQAGKSLSQINMDWGSTVGAIRWNHSFSGRCNSNLSVYGNFYHMDSEAVETQKLSDGNTSNKSVFGSGIKDGAVLYDLDFIPSSSHFFRFGASAIIHNYTPQTHRTVSYSSPLLPPLNYKSETSYLGGEAAVYAEDEISIGDWWRLNPGLRYVIMTSSGKFYHSLEPRFSSRITFGADVSIKVSYTRMSQYVHLLSSSQLSLPTDIWVPITDKIKPVKTDQFSLGLYYDGLQGWEMSIESYYKKSENVIDYRDGVPLFGSSSGWEDIVDVGRGRSYGIELYVSKNTGRTTGWLSYTLSKAERQYPGGLINNGEWFPSKYDRRHIISLFSTTHISKRLDLSASWVFMSGGYLTLPDRASVVLSMNQGQELSVLKDKGELKTIWYVPGRNNYHLPPSHCLNLNLNLRTEMKHGWSVWSFGLYNAYNQMNPNMVYVSDQEPQESSCGMPMTITQMTLLPIMPTVNYTYNFR